MARIERDLSGGIDDDSEEKVERADDLGDVKETASVELEAQRKGREQLIAEINEAGSILNRSRSIMDFRSELLADAVSTGLGLSGFPALTETRVAVDGEEIRAFEIPELPSSWEVTWLQQETGLAKAHLWTIRRSRSASDSAVS